VDQLGEGLLVAGRTADGVVESIALGDRPVVGVQWHPEWSATQPDPAFAWLVAASSRTSRKALA
jgi:putative glutamine amidotransferase